MTDPAPAPDLGPLDLLVLQPTPFCNINCSYCYLPERQATRRMSDAVLDATFRRVFASGLVRGPFTIVWHAGEPLVLPPAYYQNAMDILARHNTAGVAVGHSFQSNGLLVDDAWCRFLADHREARIGLSLDGPADLHDACRQTRAGKGTHAAAMAGLRRLQAAGIPLHIISVLTHRSLDRADDLFAFYREAGVTEVGFNVEEIEGPNRASSLDAPDALARYTRFLDRFFDLATTADPPLRVREFDTALGSLLHGADLPPMTTQETRPLAILNVDTAGNFCTFSPELLGMPAPEYGGFDLGNVLADPIEAAVHSPRFRAIYRDLSAGVHACRQTCPYYQHCGGGAASNKYYENGALASTETLYCRFTRKAVLEVVLSKLEAGLARRPARAAT